jgi:glycosidase
MKARNILLLSILLLSYRVGIAQISHVEPPNWWVGMKNPALQLLIHGKAIGETTPTINYAGVTINKTTAAQSINYLFIDLLIDETTKPGTFPITFKKGNKTIYTYQYTLLPRQLSADQFQGFNSSDVIYLIVPDRFANGDPRNDIVAGLRETKIDRGFEGGRHGGDLRGMIDHLDYIANMGFTAIWTTPVLENDMDRYSYHGYSITNHYKVDPRFGTLDDYKEFAQKARQKGIKLIFDDVVNHIGLNYWWMNDLPFKDWINKVETRVNTNHRRTVHQDQYASAYDRDLMTRGWFVESMPDVNSENAFMASYIIQCSIWWIETLQLGGIRQDTYPYSNKDFLTTWSCSIMNEYPAFNIVGEEWSLNPLVTSYWQADKPRNDGYTSCLKSVMDFPLQNSLMQALRETDQGWVLGDKLNLLYEALANDFNYADPKNILVMADNHDMDRVHTQLNNDIELTKMAITYMLTIRGIPQIFYGTEILMNNSSNRNSHGIIRSDFPGGWNDDQANGFTGAGLSPEQKTMQDYVRKLLNWRKTNDAIANGKTLHFAPFNGLYVYFRYTDKNMVMVVMNKNNNPVTLETSRFQEILKGKTSATQVMTGEVRAIGSSLSIPGKSIQVLEIH